MKMMLKRNITSKQKTFLKSKIAIIPKMKKNSVFFLTFNITNHFQFLSLRLWFPLLPWFPTLKLVTRNKPWNHLLLNHKHPQDLPPPRRVKQRTLLLTNTSKTPTISGTNSPILFFQSLLVLEKKPRCKLISEIIKR